MKPKTLRHSGILAGVLLALASGAPAAEEGMFTPGVTNAALDVMGGQVDGDGARVFGGNVDWLFGENWGLQFDLAGGKADGEDRRSGGDEVRVGDDSVLGFGGHLFWSNPERGLLDFNAAHVSWGDLDLARAGFIGKWYSGPFTVTGRLEYQDADRLGSGLNSALDVRWYPLPLFMLKAGGQEADGEGQFNLGFEFLPGFGPAPGLSIVGDAARGEDGYDQFFVGLRYYFGGGGKTLRERHRRDVPLDNDWLLRDLQSLDKARQTCPYSPNEDEDLYYTYCEPPIE